MYKNLSSYIELLEREGELVRIAVPVDPVLEIAEITDRVSKSPGGGKALLFENTGTDFPVVTNLFGSDRRIAMALGAGSLDEISARLDGVLRQALVPRGSLAQKARALPLLAEMSRWFPRRISGRGECQQVVLQDSEARLSSLPVLKCQPHDGGRFITLPLVHTIHPETGASNVGMYRMQIFDDFYAGMHWHIHKTGARHYDAYKRAGVSRMPVSVCLGGDPVYTYAATAPMPEGMDEYLLAGFLRERPVRLVKCLTNDIWVPSDCDFVIEGWVDTCGPLRTEGPFGDHTGFYSLEDNYPVFHVSAITRRRDAVYPATLVGIPPQEDAYFAAATEKIFLPPIRCALQPEVRDLHMPVAGVAHNLAVVSMDVAYPGQPEKVANALWSAGQMMFNKVMIAVPADVDPRDEEAVMALLGGIDVSRDIIFGHGVADVLDHAMAEQGLGGKLLIDLTVSPRKRTSAPLRLASKSSHTPRYSAVSEPSQALHMSISDEKLNFIFDAAAEGLSPFELLWLGLANIDPARDVSIVDGKAVFDCRAKISRAPGMPARWPNVVAMDETVIALVDSRWAEYGIEMAISSAVPEQMPKQSSFLPSPSRRYRKLLLPGGAEVRCSTAVGLFYCSTTLLNE